MVCSRKKDNVAKAVAQIEKSGGKAEGIVADVGIVADRQKLVKLIAEKYGKLDVLRVTVYSISRCLKVVNSCS